MSKITPFEFEQARQRTERARDPDKAAAQDAAKLEKFAAGQERELSRQFCAWLTLHGVLHIVARTDRKSTVRPGWPDVTAMYRCNLWNWHARVCCIELKAKGGVLSEDQKKCHAELNAARIPLIVAYDLETAITFVRKTLRIGIPL